MLSLWAMILEHRLCFFMVEIGALQKHPRSCDPEHLTVKVYAFPSDGRRIGVESMSFPREHRNTAVKP